MSKEILPETWHINEVPKTLEQLKTQLSGLDENEVQNRLKIYGPNSLKPPKRRNFATRFLTQFNHLLIYVLLGSAIVTALLKHWIDMSVILSVVLINALVGVIQEGKAEKALEAISHMLSLQATVIRSGISIIVPATTLVPGDIILLKSGNKVPADLRLIETKNLQIQEAILTGESVAIEKSTTPVAADTELSDRTCMAYSGTFVTYGTGKGIVVATGENTEVGRIGAMLSEVPTLTTPLLKQINEFSRWLTIIILAAASITFLFGVFLRNYPASEMFMAAVSLAVAAIPEGLPAIITITLAIGVTRMAKRHAIIRRLPVVETLGSVTVICTDKTGTLTLNELTVQNVITAQHQYYVSGVGYGANGDFQLNEKIIEPDDNVDLSRAILAAILCNDADLSKINNEWHLSGNPMDGALLSLGLKAKLDLHFQKQAYPLTDLIPFESEHKFMATLHHDHEGNGYIYVKGAPECILAMCTSQFSNGQSVPLNKNYWINQIESLARQGQRVLAIAMRTTTSKHRDLKFNDVENGLTLLALFGLLDSPREEAITAIAQCRKAGISVKMITGDHAATAKSIAKQLGIKNCEQVLSGHELNALTTNEFENIVDEVDIYARTSPTHKLKLVEALQTKNNIVAMTGDGVNDAPALKRANVGIAMGIKGTEAAKESAEIVLADDNFASIVAAVKEGRTVYDNLRKAILFVLPTNGGEALIVIIAILLGMTLPISPVQILWVNMVTAVTLGLALAFEPEEKDVMERSPRKPNTPIFSPLLFWRLIFISILILLGGFGFFSWAQSQQLSLAAARTVVVNTFVIAEIMYLINSRKIYASTLNWEGLFGSVPVLLSIVTVILLQLLFTYAPFMQRLFDTSSLNLKEWLYIILFGVGLFLVVELEKVIGRKFHSIREKK